MAAPGVRLRWEALPHHVRDRIADRLGSAVVAAADQPTGFSPGLAARCRLADGRRVFVKAVSPDQNPDTPGLHRAEARVAAGLPSALPVPDLLAVVDDGHGVVLVFEDV